MCWRRLRHVWRGNKFVQQWEGGIQSKLKITVIPKSLSKISQIKLRKNAQLKVKFKENEINVYKEEVTKASEDCFGKEDKIPYKYG